MEIFWVLIFGFSLWVGWCLANQTKEKSEKKFELEVLNFNKGLSPLQVAHNERNKWKIKEADDKYSIDCAIAKFKQQNAQYYFMVGEVNAMTVKDKWEKYHSKWVDYVNEWNTTSMSRDERQLGSMPLHTFIATEISPYKSYGFEFVHRPTIGIIEYV